jgi:hypothetical protein
MYAFYGAEIISETAWVYYVVYQIVTSGQVYTDETSPWGTQTPVPNVQYPRWSPKPIRIFQRREKSQCDHYSDWVILAQGVVKWITNKQTATKPPAYTEDGNGFSSRNVGKPSHPDAAVCPIKFQWILSPREFQNVNTIDITENKQKTSIQIFPNTSKHRRWLPCRSKSIREYQKDAIYRENWARYGDRFR